MVATVLLLPKIGVSTFALSKVTSHSNLFLKGDETYQLFDAVRRGCSAKKLGGSFAGGAWGPPLGVGLSNRIGHRAVNLSAP